MSEQNESYSVSNVWASTNVASHFHFKDINHREKLYTVISTDFQSSSTDFMLQNQRDENIEL